MHQHDFKPLYTGKLNGEEVTYFKCPCGETKEEQGNHMNLSEYTWASNAAKYTK